MKTWYLGVTTTRKIVPMPGLEKERGEFAVLRQLTSMGIEAFVPKKIEFVRQGKRRYPDPISSPFMPGYVFLNAGPEEFYKAMDCRGLARTLMALREGELRSAKRDKSSKLVKPGQKYVGLDGVVVSIDRFGISAPGDIVMSELGITVDNVVKKAALAGLKA